MSDQPQISVGVLDYVQRVGEQPFDGDDNLATLISSRVVSMATPGDSGGSQR